MFMDFCVKTEGSLLMARNMSSYYEECCFAETHVFGGNQTDIKHSVNVNSVKTLKEKCHLE
jgi:hypothetical protein